VDAHYGRVEHIPVVWLKPAEPSSRLAIWVPSGLGKKEDTIPRLEQLAADGFVALSFDPWLHGERGGGESPEKRSRAA